LRVFIFLTGVIKINYYEKKMDYSKWLGPDQEYSFEGAGLQVANHQSWMDILALTHV
jgi:1-acyl-sn-glycerol-3-phosphate acyltransferase